MIRLEFVQSFQVGLYGGAHIHDVGIVFVFAEEVSHIVFGDARHGCAQLIQGIQFTHVESHHPLRAVGYPGRTQLVFDSDNGIVCRGCLCRRS